MKRQKIMILIGALMALAFVTSACNKAGSSPTATAKAFYEAAKSKDIQGMKSLLAKKTLDALEQFAKANNTTVDEFLKKSNDQAPPPATFESRNEQINGDSATLEVNQDGKGNWQTVRFVKEDGQWKFEG